MGSVLLFTPRKIGGCCRGASSLPAFPPARTLFRQHVLRGIGEGNVTLAFAAAGVRR